MQQAIKKMFGYPLADEYARNMLSNISTILSASLVPIPLNLSLEK